MTKNGGWPSVVAEHTDEQRRRTVTAMIALIWMMHCHKTYHQEVRMMTSVDYIR